MLKNVYEELIANRMMNQRLWNMMSSLKNDIKKLVGSSTPILRFSDEIEDKTFLENFPPTNKEHVFKV